MRRMARKIVLILTAAVSIVISFAAVSEADWYNSSWLYRKPITISNSMVANTNQTNFPVLIYLASDSNVASHAQADGDDILFTSSDGTTKLSHEIEKYTSATGQLYAWVKVPTLSASSNTTLYMYYGNASCTNQQNATAVWDNYYKAVWHMHNASSPATDSTSNARNAAEYGGVTFGATGKISGATSYDGTNDYLKVSSGVANWASYQWTIEFWTNGNFALDAGEVDDGLPPNGGFYFNFDLAYKGRFYSVKPAEGWNTYDVLTTNTFSLSGWHHVVCVVNGTNVANLTCYVDGTPYSFYNGHASLIWDAASLTGITYTFILVQRGNLWYSNNWQYGTGSLDELRISDTVRSADWITTAYRNQNNPASYETAGAEEGTGIDAFFLLFD